MNQSSNRADSAAGEVPPELRAVLVYEDFQMAVEGKRVCDFLAKEVGGQGTLDLSVWKYDFLAMPELGRAAADQAQRADVVVLAARNGQNLPHSVKAWLESWASRRKVESGALVGLIASTSARAAKSSAVGLQLLRTAGAAGMDFFCSSPDMITGQLARCRV